MAIGEIILAAFLEALYEKLLKVKIFAANLDKEVDSLSETLTTIRVLLDSAERRQNDDGIGINKWLQHLREVAYEANDLLDEVAYEAIRRRHGTFREVLGSCSDTLEKKVLNFSLYDKLSFRRSRFDGTTSGRITKIRESLEKIVSLSSALGLGGAPENGAFIAQATSESSSVGHDTVFGRELDEDAILKLVLSDDDFSKDNVDFISICGKAGLGKTTLAQIVFNAVSVKGHFQVKMWVHASHQDDGDDIVNVRAVIKAAIESITRERCELPNLDAMQLKLRQLLEQKKYLLVLDALLNDRGGFLDVLKKTLANAGANGSKVLITTPKRSISTLLHAVHTHELRPLSKDACREVIKRHAFCDRNPDAHPYLNTIVEKIAGKCNGLPLAAKRYGLLLMAETERERWESISRKEVGEILESDYDVSKTLPGNMKRCFAYCCIFPSGFIFDRGQLVQQWLAQDFVPTEEKGREYFDQMFRWSLFRYPHSGDNCAQHMYVMDDDIRSKAKSIAGDECFVMHHGDGRKVSKMARHASFIWTPEPTENSSGQQEGGHMGRGTTRTFALKHSTSKFPWSRKKPGNPTEPNFQDLLTAEGLYTLKICARMQVPEILTSLRCLRTLDLSNTDLYELPDSIGDLKHLRCLALHNTQLKSLPNSLTKLFHLQSLGLRNCYELADLPKKLWYLTNLRHLDLHLDDNSMKPGGLRSMPRKIGKLTSLRTLSRFVVSKNSRCGVSELAGMSELGGSLAIISLELVGGAEEARKANLVKKEGLQMLEYRWGEDVRTHNSGIDAEAVLDQLRPNGNIRELKVGGYGGDKWPSWIGDQSFSSLAAIKMYNCKNLSGLPPLGRLPSLKRLHVEGLHNWCSWAENEDSNLPSLRELVIRNCACLRSLHATLPVLTKLEIDGCPSLSCLPRIQSLHSLKVTDCGSCIWSSFSLSSPVTNACVNLSSLEISDCETLYSMPDDCLPTGLTCLKIDRCPKLEALPGGLKYLQSLRKLHVQSCEGLLSLSMPIYLTSLDLSYCPNLSFKPTDRLPAGLRFVSVSDCPKLIHFFQLHSRAVARLPSVWIDGILMVSSDNSGASTSQ